MAIGNASHHHTNTLANSEYDQLWQQIHSWITT